MKKGKKSAVLFCVMSVMILAGCKDTSTPPAPDTQEVKEEIKQEAEEETPEIDKNEGPVESTQEEPEASSEAAGSFKDDFENGIVKNGSYFVRIGNKVYFRKISQDSMDAGAQFGQFINTESTPTKCPLICYDLDTGKYEEVGEITGVGKLYACPEGFYIGKKDRDNYDKSTTDLYDMATGESTFYCAGTPLGISAGGQILAVDRMVGQTIHTVLIKNGEEIADLGGENIYYEYCGFAGETLIALLHTADDEFIVCSVDENGDVTQLGQVGAGKPSYPELEEFVMSGGDLYLTFGYYEGTGHFLFDYETVKGVPGKEGSLTKADVFDDDNEEYPENTVPKLCFEPEGVAFYSDHRTYEVYMGTGDNSNDLCYYDDIYEECVLVKDFVKKDYGEKCQVVQDITTFPETVFVIYADAQEDDEYSIGWRTGYKMTGWHICAIPFGLGQYDEDSAAKGIVYFE
ncbi:MAG: hypothetical protein J5910_10045 [Lachnospiraceae bacterium]|nr:hypothetical protein [Lachnospiraceae bacterium]